MKRQFITASIARNNAQSFNRNQWLNHAMDKIANTIIPKSNVGLRSTTFSIGQLIQGAENLHEAGELLQLLQKEFVTAGYTVKIDIDGNLTISW